MRADVASPYLELCLFILDPRLNPRLLEADLVVWLNKDTEGSERASYMIRNGLRHGGELVALGSLTPLGDASRRQSALSSWMARSTHDPVRRPQPNAGLTKLIMQKGRICATIAN